LDREIVSRDPKDDKTWDQGGMQPTDCVSTSLSRCR
jgi:hypothetical protein